MFSKFRLSAPSAPELNLQQLVLQLQHSNALYREELVRNSQQMAKMHEHLQKTEMKLHNLQEEAKRQSLKYINSSTSFWELTKRARFKKKKRIAESLRPVLEKLPKAFTPLEVSQNCYQS